MKCQHDKSEVVLEVKGVKLYKCHFCGLIFAVNSKNCNLSYKNYYQKETGGRFNFGIEYLVKFFRFLRALKIFFIAPNAKSVLDIGSGRGWMLYFLKKYFKYQVAAGTQISENAYKFSKEKLKLEIYNQDLLELDFGRNFEVITLWHVLEHIADPEAYIEKISEMLENNGILLIEVPNFNSWSRILSKSYWLALDPTHHLTFFTQDSLKLLLEKYNLKIKQSSTFSLEYSAFTSVQSLVNLITGTNGYFFDWLRKGGFTPTPKSSSLLSDSEENKLLVWGFNIKIIFHTLLFLILFPACFLINLALYFSNRGEIINIIAKKQ
ncbi:MAG: class I SAM-dependent methyltransferase [Patescibacteria group bacterium]